MSSSRPATCQEKLAIAAEGKEGNLCSTGAQHLLCKKGGLMPMLEQVLP